jgi:hypothetical protein
MMAMSAQASFISIMVGLTLFVIICKIIARRQRGLPEMPATGIVASAIGIAIMIAVIVDGATSNSSDGSGDDGGGDGGGGGD